MATQTATKQYFSAIGRRKTAIATVRLITGSGVFTCNGRVHDLEADMLIPLQLADMVGKFDILAKVIGGGKVSQIEAIRLGIARGLVKFNPELRITLKKSGLLTRDPREKERKKCGLKRARKAPQWSKR